MSYVSYPTKEQVRAYMHGRGGADRPPPAPAEIRRQLNWSYHGTAPRLCREEHPAADTPIASQTILFPGKIAQLGTLLVLEWLFCVAGFDR